MFIILVAKVLVGDLKLQITSTAIIDAHGLKIQGRGYLMFFAKIPRGGQGFQEKLPGRVPLFRVLLHFY